MSEQAPKGAGQENVSEQPKTPESAEAPKSPEKAERTVEQVNKELQDTAKVYADLYKGIDTSFNATARLLAETVGGANLKGKNTIGEQMKTMEQKENWAMQKMSELAKELSSHPDAPKDLADIMGMSTNRLAEHFGGKLH